MSTDPTEAEGREREALLDSMVEHWRPMVLVDRREIAEALLAVVERRVVEPLREQVRLLQARVGEVNFKEDEARAAVSRLEAELAEAKYDVGVWIASFDNLKADRDALRAELATVRTEYDESARSDNDIILGFRRDLSRERETRVAAERERDLAREVGRETTSALLAERARLATAETLLREIKADTNATNTIGILERIDAFLVTP